MLNVLVLLVLLGLIAFSTAAAAWAVIEADRTGALDTGEHEDDEGRGGPDGAGPGP